MADSRVNSNYILIELLHFSFLIRDSFEYMLPQIKVTQETFNNRKAMAKNMLEEGKFLNSWINNHPNEEVKKFYSKFVNYFDNVYENENYVSFETFKAETDKLVDFLEETVTSYQIAEDILKAFYNEYKKTPDTIDTRIEKNLITSLDFYRVTANWVLFNEIIRNDGEYKKALQASNNQTSYEVNYNLNILKRLIGIYNFNKERYIGDKVDIKAMLEDSMTAFKALDGSLFKDYEKKNNKTLTDEEKQKMAKEVIDKAASECVNALRIYEPIWRQTYSGVPEFMKENPLNQNNSNETAENSTPTAKDSTDADA